ncbi:MAG: hypothetical protein AAFN30_07855 [Actinomycetota bacterium]
MGPRPTLQVALTRAELRHGVLLVAKTRRPLDEPLGPGLAAVALDEARRATVAEAHWLVAARDPGVVAVRRVEPARASLWTGHAAVATLANTTPSSPSVAAILADVAATAARLHQRGLIHGAITADHILLVPTPTAPVTGRRRPQASAQRPGAVRAVLCAPATGSADPADDVEAVIDLVEDWWAGVTHRAAAWELTLAALGRRPGSTPSRPTMGTVAAVLERLAARLAGPPGLDERRLAARAWWAAVVAELRA